MCMGALRARHLNPSPRSPQELLKNVQRSKGVPTEDVETEDIVPDPG